MDAGTIAFFSIPVGFVLLLILLLVYVRKQDTNDSCFWGHSWSNWEQYYNPYYTIPRQKRICDKCNEMEDKIV